MVYEDGISIVIHIPKLGPVGITVLLTHVADGVGNLIGVVSVLVLAIAVVIGEGIVKKNEIVLIGVVTVLHAAVAASSVVVGTLSAVACKSLVCRITIKQTYITLTPYEGVRAPLSFPTHLKISTAKLTAPPP